MSQSNIGITVYKGTEEASGGVTDWLGPFRRAVSLDADGVELDVHATRDGVMVVHRDPDIPGDGLLAQLSFAETQEIRLPNGETIPPVPHSADDLSFALTRTLANN